MPTGQVFRWHCAAMTQPMARRAAVPKTEFVRAENGGKHDIAREFQASIHAERET